MQGAVHLQGLFTAAKMLANSCAANCCNDYASLAGSALLSGAEWNLLAVQYRHRGKLP